MTSSLATALTLAEIHDVAQRAIHHRLRGSGPYGATIYHVTETSDGVVVHCNSGGNYVAAETALLHAGYSVAEDGFARRCCDEPGVPLVVTDKHRAPKAAARAKAEALVALADGLAVTAPGCKSPSLNASVARLQDTARRQLADLG